MKEREKRGHIDTVCRRSCSFLHDLYLSLLLFVRLFTFKPELNASGVRTFVSSPPSFSLEIIAHLSSHTWVLPRRKKQERNKREGRKKWKKKKEDSVCCFYYLLREGEERSTKKCSLSVLCLERRRMEGGEKSSVRTPHTGWAPSYDDLHLFSFP